MEGSPEVTWTNFSITNFPLSRTANKEDNPFAPYTDHGVNNDFAISLNTDLFFIIRTGYEFHEETEENSRVLSYSRHLHH